MAGSSVVSVRVPRWAKRVLDERGVEYQRIIREVLIALAESASGAARERLLEAFRIADQAAGEEEMSIEEIVEATRGCGGCRS